MEHYLDLLAVRQKLIATNIANAATPGYQTVDLDFQFEFKQALLGEKVAEPVRPAEVAGLRTRNDGNNVNLDRESRLLAETAMRFRAASVMWRGEMRQIRSAIEEGKNA